MSTFTYSVNEDMLINIHRIKSSNFILKQLFSRTFLSFLYSCCHCPLFNFLKSGFMNGWVQLGYMGCFLLKWRAILCVWIYLDLIWFMPQRPILWEKKLVKHTDWIFLPCITLMLPLMFMYKTFVAIWVIEWHIST